MQRGSVNAQRYFCLGSMGAQGVRPSDSTKMMLIPAAINGAKRRGPKAPTGVVKPDFTYVLCLFVASKIAHSAIIFEVSVYPGSLPRNSVITLRLGDSPKN